MRSRIRWLRILLAGFLSELAIFAVFIPGTMVLGQMPGMYIAVGASFLMPFLFGIWTTRRVDAHFVFQGALVGAVGIVIYIGLTRGGAEPLLYVLAHGLKLLGGAAGGYVSRSRRPPVVLAPAD